MEIIKSRKGNDLICYNGYIYRGDKLRSSTISWRCTQENCKGRLTTSTDYKTNTLSQEAIETGTHYHPQNPIEKEVRRLENEVKKRAVGTCDSPHSIIQTMLDGVPKIITQNQRLGTNLARMVRRKRRSGNDSWSTQRKANSEIKKKWENLVSKTKRKVRDGHMTPDFDWNETNTLVMQFLASATAAMRVKQQQQVESSVTSAYLMEAGGNANSIGGYAYPGSGFSSAVFPSVSNNTTNINNPGSTDASFSGVNTGNGGSSGSNCKSEDQANKNQVTIDDSSNDEGTTADEAERNDESSSVNNNQHGMPPWACIGVDESLLSHLTPLGPTNPLTSLNFGQFGSSTSLMQQEELMQQAREEHRLKIEVLHLQKRAWQMKVDQLSRYISSNTNADVNMGVSAGDEMM